jgi:hypothetical protein
MNWEYLSFQTKLLRDTDETQNEYLTRSLNELGQAGWELVTYANHQYVFKRPLAAKITKKTGQSTGK